MGTHVRERESHVREFDMVEVGALRQRVGAAIEALVDLLDSLEPDPDLEPAGDERDASYPEGWRAFAGPPDEDAEDDDAGEDDDPRECSWAETLNQGRIGRHGGTDEDSEYSALERHGTGFIASGPDDSEDSDPGGGDVCDEPHDADTFDDIIADADARDQLHDELAFQRWMEDSRDARFKAHEATRTQILKVTGRKPGSHWGIPARIHPW